MMSENYNHKGEQRTHRKPPLRLACTDYWVLAVWTIWAVAAATAWGWWWYGQSPWLSSITLVLVALLVIIPLFLSVTRRAALVFLSRRASREDRHAAMRIVWSWRRCVTQLFDPKKDRDTGEYVLPGLRALRIGSDGLELVVQLPRVRIPKAALIDVETMADVLGVDEVQYLRREGDRVHYLVIPVDLTEDDRHVAVG